MIVYRLKEVTQLSAIDEWLTNDTQYIKRIRLLLNPAFIQKKKTDHPNKSASVFIRCLLLVLNQPHSLIFIHFFLLKIKSLPQYSDDLKKNFYVETFQIAQSP